MSQMLYIVATPIGNLEDITFRALETLKKVDFIAAEDTRVTLKLLTKFQIKKPLMSYYAHNLKESGEAILKKLLDGQSCALVTDAGTPVISDPGVLLLKLCRENNIPITPIPGASAVICALSASELCSGRFCFEGFLSVNKSSRSAHLESLKNEQRTIVFYEAPHKLLKTLKDIYSAFGERGLTVARELTKLHEEILTTTLSNAIEIYENKSPKGEFVLIIDGSKKEDKIITPEIIESDNFKDIIASLREQGLSRNEAYKLTLQHRRPQ